MTSRPRNILVSGDFFVVEFASRDDGKEEAYDWWQEQDEKIREWYEYMFQRICDAGPIRDRSKVDKVSDDKPVYEFKHVSANLRIYGYLFRGRILLSRGRQKPGGKGNTKPEDVRHAEEVALEQLRREGALPAPGATKASKHPKGPQSKKKKGRK